jgi:hypothetical protein
MKYKGKQPYMPAISATGEAVAGGWCWEAPCRKQLKQKSGGEAQVVEHSTCFTALCPEFNP